MIERQSYDLLVGVGVGEDGGREEGRLCETVRLKDKTEIETETETKPETGPEKRESTVSGPRMPLKWDKGQSHDPKFLQYSTCTYDT